MSLNHKHLLILFMYFWATMCSVYSNNLNQNSKHLDVPSNVLKTNFSNIHGHMRTDLDIRKNHLVKQHRYRRGYGHRKFVGKHNLPFAQKNEKNMLQPKDPLEKGNVLLIQTENPSHDMQNSPSHETDIQSKISKEKTRSIIDYIQKRSRFSEKQVAKKSLNPFEEVLAQEIKLIPNNKHKFETCGNRNGCKHKSHISKRDHYTNAKSSYTGNNDCGNNGNIVIDVKNDTFKDKTDKNSKALLQEIVEQLNDIRENGATFSHGINCVVNGHWKSQIGGMSVNITGYNTTYQNLTFKNITNSLTVNLFENPEKISTIKHPVLNRNWTLTGHVPRTSNETIILNAENVLNKHVAVFIGQCMYCDGSELLAGQWLIHYNVKDCKHVEIGEMVRGDIFKRIQMKNETQLHKH